MMKNRNILAALSFAALAAFGAVGAPTPLAAQEEEGERRSSRQSQTLDPIVGRTVQQIYEQDIATENWPVAIQKLTALINERGAKFKPYDKAIVYQLRGQSYSQLEDPNYRAALRDFQTVVDSGGLPPEQVDGIRYAIAQLNFALGDYNAAIKGLNDWIRSAQAAGKTPDANAYYLLAAAYAQIEPPNYRAATDPAERAVALRAEPKKSDHDLLNLIYSETGANQQRGALLEKMINIWPNESGYWRQLSGLYSTTGKDKDAFAVLEVAYRAGLITKEAELNTLVQYYSFFENPYRGAKLLEKEMNAGNIQRNFKNLRLLSQLWSQARENKRAIETLEAAAKLGSDGELFYRLGQRLVADEQYAKAEQALASARAKGGLDQKQIGDTWMLTGTARFSRAGPDDCAGRASARAAFMNATRYADSARQARSWVQYIDAINSTVEAQDRLAWQQANEERKATIDRLKQQVTVCKLQGGASAECAALETRLATLVEEDQASRTAPAFGCKTAKAESEESSGAGDGVNADGAAPTGEPADGESEAGGASVIKPDDATPVVGAGPDQD